MKIFEFFVATSAISTNGGPYIPDHTLTYAIPDEAQELLEPILGPYDQDPMWYFDKLNYGRPPAPWAIACLDKEYAIAGHIASCRPEGSGILFTQYTNLPKPIPYDFIPKVGTITMLHKTGLEKATARSPLFEELWLGLKDRDLDRRWLIIADPLRDDWLTKVLPVDNNLWNSTRPQ